MRGYTVDRKISDRKTWMGIVTIFGVLYANGIVCAHPVYERVARENAMSMYDTLLNFSKMGEIGAAAEELNEEISEASKERYKRLSDQRRAELETLMALSKMTGKLMNVIRGGRQSQSSKTNDRKKRSTFDINMKNLQKLFRLSGKLGYKGNAAYPIIS
ncbi:uncharacterized protein LOC105735943 [Apis florea]|uniref:uncharacterized protein LOC105735943 n=1 Tax=Apis florea TaxID=7463 RepID=UPI0006294C25|nr:uncharacterized protein LOC105735943 [Apis florea]